MLLVTKTNQLRTHNNDARKSTSRNWFMGRHSLGEPRLWPTTTIAQHGQRILDRFQMQTPALDHRTQNV